MRPSSYGGPDNLASVPPSSLWSLSPVSPVGGGSQSLAPYSHVANSWPDPSGLLTRQSCIQSTPQNGRTLGSPGGIEACRQLISGAAGHDGPILQHEAGLRIMGSRPLSCMNQRRRVMSSCLYRSPL